MNKITKRNIQNLLVPSNFFLKLFCVPSVIWLIISFLTMIPDETDPNTITWWQSMIVDIFLILVWYIISYTISLIVAEVKKNKPKTKIVKEIRYITKDNNKKVVNNIAKNSNIEERKADEIVISKPKHNSKCLYTCEGVFNAYEYKIMAKYFPKRIYWVFVFKGIYLNLLFTAIFTLIYKNVIVTVLFFIAYQLYLMLFYKIGLQECCEKHVNSYLKKLGVTHILFETEFYENYFIRKSNNASFTIKYSDITRCVENETHFYFDYPQRNTIIIIQKNKCDSDLINFIRKKFNNLEKR